MSRTYRRPHYHWYFWSNPKINARMYRDGTSPFLNHGCKAGSSGFFSNGDPEGYGDDLPRTNDMKRLVNHRRRQWNKDIINEEVCLWLSIQHGEDCGCVDEEEST